MEDELLRKLGRTVRRWRKNKGHASGRVPSVLVEQIEAAIAGHGVSAVEAVAGPIAKKIGARLKVKALSSRSVATPAFSRIQFETKRLREQPIAEAETPQGFKVRIFSNEPEALALLRELFSSSSKETVP